MHEGRQVAALSSTGGNACPPAARYGRDGTPRFLGPTQAGAVRCSRPPQVGSSVVSQPARVPGGLRWALTTSHAK
jgi:hypothetical protein